MRPLVAAVLLTTQSPDGFFNDNMKSECRVLANQVLAIVGLEVQ